MAFQDPFWPWSGHASAILLNHLTTDGKKLLSGNRPGQEPNIWAVVKPRIFPIAAQNQHRHGRKARDQLRHKSGASHSRAIEPYDNQAKSFREKSIFY